MNEPRVAIIVLNWNNWRDTLECLGSLNDLEYKNHSIWIVDNGSRNDSVQQILGWLENCGRHVPIMSEKEVRNPESPSSIEVLSEASAARFLLIRLEENRGYAGGNNAALKLAGRFGYDYAWVLNNDTWAFPDALKELVFCAEQDRRVGMLVSNLIHVSEYPDVRDKKKYFRDQQLEVESLAGGSILARMECLRDIGFIDENYFCYMEEVDWSLKARREGWKLIRNYRSSVYHKWGSSTQSTRIEKSFFGKKILRVSWKGFLIPGYYESRNGIYFMKKNHRIRLIPYAILRTLHLILQIALYDDHKLGRIGIILKGTWDGLLGRMGKADISA